MSRPGAVGDLRSPHNGRVDAETEAGGQAAGDAADDATSGAGRESAPAAAAGPAPARPQAGPGPGVDPGTDSDTDTDTDTHADTDEADAAGAGPGTDDAAAGEDPALVAAQREERARRRLRQTARDMVISMAVVTVGVLALWLPFHRGTPDPVRTVDPASVVAGARSTEPWPVYAPVGLPATWRCTSARIDTALDGQDVVHLGYLTPDEKYVGLEQSATKALSFVSDATVQGRATGSRTVAGSTWTTYESDDGSHRSLVRQASGATYVVVGTASWDEIATFTTSLRAG